MLSRAEALELLEREIEADALRKHMLAVAAIMAAIAAKLAVSEEEQENWLLAGLLHDLDYELTQNEFEKHALITAELLAGKLPAECLEAIKAHNPRTGCAPTSEMARALIAADALAGLIIPTALMMPSRKLADVRVQSLTKKFKDKSFARTVSRDKIMSCESLGLTRNELFALALDALQPLSAELGV